MKKNRDVDSVLLKDIEGFWVCVNKYQGEYYLHNNWESLIAYELTDSTWTNINMEVYPELLLKLQGNRGHFKLETDCLTGEFTLIDRKREIYKFSSSRWSDLYVIPARRIHDFEIIEYIGITGNLLPAFVEFD